MDWLSDSSVLVEKVLLWIAGLLIAFDIYLYINKDDWSRTISHVIKGWINDRFFFVTFLWGVLAGHFFLGAKNPPIDNNTWSLVIVLSLGLLLFLIGYFFKITKLSGKYQLGLLLFGMIIGHFFWSLNT